MTEWVRAGGDGRCGRCGGLFRRGDAVLRVVIGPADRRVVKVRCGTCAGPAPPDLPAFVEVVTERPPLLLMRTFRDMLPLDYRQRAAGDRDPGEEG